MTNFAPLKYGICRNAGAVIWAAASVFACLHLSSANAGDIIVKFDQSQILRLDRPAAEIIIGNPTIADVTIQSGNILVVTGKSFGITNVIALDAERNVIQDQRLTVQRDEVGVVNVMKGVNRSTYACSPQCNPTITIGDDAAFLEATMKASQAKVKFSESGGNTEGQQQGGGN
jgi:Flp pilus assembly secretin CpaC